MTQQEQLTLERAFGRLEGHLDGLSEKLDEHAQQDRTSVAALDRKLDMHLRSHGLEDASEREAADRAASVALATNHVQLSNRAIFRGAVMGGLITGVPATVFAAVQLWAALHR